MFNLCPANGFSVIAHDPACQCHTSVHGADQPAAPKQLHRLTLRVVMVARTRGHDFAGREIRVPSTEAGHAPGIGINNSTTPPAVSIRLGYRSRAHETGSFATILFLCHVADTKLHLHYSFRQRPRFVVLYP